jgi:signal peptidase II
MRRLILVALFFFLADQATKWLVLGPLRLDEVASLAIWPGVVELHMAWNRGVNFGLLPADGALGRWALVAVALAISAWVVIWVRRGGGVWAEVSGGLLVGGAMGNVLDRLLHGAVADFLNVSCCGIVNPFSFNVADIAIFLGALGLVLAPQGARKTP